MTLDRSPIALAIAMLEERLAVGGRDDMEANYETWLSTMFAGYAKYPLADHHHVIWDWFWSLTPTLRPSALIVILARGAAKSTSAELGVVACGVRRTRRYVVYVSETQDLADKHVASIGSMLEADTIERFYPEMGERLVNKFGASKGWRRNRLRTGTGFTVDALGLDTAARGIRVEDQRPDLIVLDDIDSESDSAKTTAKKVEVITKGIIPAGAPNVAVLGVQNLIHADSIFARLADGRADFLRLRTVIGPIPGLRNFSYRSQPDGTYEITSGEATWEGGSVETYERLLNDIGPRAFLTEVQHEVDTVEGAIATGDEIEACRRMKPPHPAEVIRTLVMVDPAVSHSSDSDETGITVQRLGLDRHVYLLDDLSCRAKVDTWADVAVGAAVKYEAGQIAYEENQGGEAIESALRHALVRANVTDVGIKPVRASKSKFDRALSLQDAIRQQRWHPVGHFPELERQVKTTTASWTGPSPDRLDAAVHGLRELDLGVSAPLNPAHHKGQSITGDLMTRAW